MEEKRFLTVPEVAVLLRMPAETVRARHRNGAGPVGFRVGKRLLFDAAAVEAYITHAKAGAR
ncbi:MAG TPA: helix-turn-helix domain-containing protein [Acidimicrobiales bacterium]